MAHNLEIKNGKASFFGVREAAWHGLGTIIEEAANKTQAMELAGLNFDVVKRPLYDAQGKEVSAFGTFRTDNGAFLGAVGKVYQPIQNEYMFDFVDALLNNVDGSHYETAGTLGKGEAVWTLAKVPCDFTLPGTDDKHETYICFTTRHDGKGTASAFLTTTRIVCQNTLNAAIRHAENAMKVKHSARSEVKLEAVKALMKNTIDSVKPLQEKLTMLASRQMTKDSYQTIVDRLFPIPIDGDRSTRTENVLEQILSLYDSNDNNAIPEVKGTAYNMLNAITEYSDHFRTAKNDKRAESAIFGSGNKFKNDALEIVLESTVSNPASTYARLAERYSLSEQRASFGEPEIGASVLDAILQG